MGLCEGGKDQEFYNRFMEESTSAPVEMQLETPIATPVKAGPMNILLTGSGGMLGSDLLDELVKRGHMVRSPRKVDYDLTVSHNIDRIRKQDFGMFDWIINCAAYTAVDAAENDRMAAMHVNSVLPGSLGIAAQGCGARVLHVSTDFVFDGRSSTPYREDSATGPQSVYGMSKLMGEENLIKEAPDSVIVRTSWLFGPNGRSFPRTMIELFRQGKELKVVGDQVGKPTYTRDLAKLISDMAEGRVASGIYHAAGPTVSTWWDFAVMAIATDVAAKGGDFKGVKDKIARITTADYPTPARRPAYSVLDTSKIESLGYLPMRPLTEALIEFVARLNSN